MCHRQGVQRDSGVSILNYGSPIRWVTMTVFGGTLHSAEHEGVSGHERLKPGEQCACGVLGLGIHRSPDQVLDNTGQFQ